MADETPARAKGLSDPLPLASVEGPEQHGKVTAGSRTSLRGDRAKEGIRIELCTEGPEIGAVLA